MNPQNQTQITDPSGHSDAKYWNSFFQTLGGQKEFEWYTSPSEIHRILSTHYNTTKQSTIMFHPGSGNSLLPTFLRNELPSSHHIVFDCSDVAIKEMIDTHDEQRERVDYMVGDVLETLPFLNDVFDVWIDKGLIDALFDTSEECLTKCQFLFREACRILKERGMVVITTLAQDHSLELIMNSVIELKLWSQVFLYEVDHVPGSTSTLRPFVFLFMTRDASEPSASSIIVNKRNGESLSIDIPKDTPYHIDSLKEYLEASRQEFKSTMLKNQVLNTFKRKSTKVTFEIKPYDAETNLELIKNNLMEKFSSCTWLDFDIVPIGFGISKLIAVCVLAENDDVDTLCEAIEEEEEDVQSVDIESVVYV